MLHWDKEELSFKASVGTIIFHLFLLILFFWLGLSAPFPPPEEEGFILVNIGDTKLGSGPVAISPKAEKETKKSPSVASSNAAKNKEIDKKVMTAEDEESVKLSTEKNKKKKESKKNDKKPADSEKEDVKKEPTVNKSTIFTKRDSNTEDVSGEGDDPSDLFNNKGQKTGNSETSTNYTDSASGPAGIKFNLSGRSLKDISIPKDNSQQEGTVAIKIRVDKFGKVLDASWTSVGSTTNDSDLRKLAVAAAKKAKFDFNPDAPDVQTGELFFKFTTQ